MTFARSFLPRVVLLSCENGDPGPTPYFHNTLGTPSPHFHRKLGPSHENGDPQCWTCILTGLISLAMTS